MAAAPAEPEPATVAEEPVFPVPKETESQGRECRACGHTAEPGNLPSPDRCPGIVDDQGTGLIRNNPGHLRNSGIRDSPELGVGN